MNATARTAPGPTAAAPSRPPTQPPARSAVPFWIVAAMTSVALAASATPSPLYVDYQQRWHFSSTTLTMIYAMYAAGVLVTLLLAGGLSDRVGRRPVLLGGIGALAGSMLVFVGAQGTGWLYAARGFQGLATGLFTGAAGAALVDLHPRRDARVAGLVNSATQSLGIAGGALVAGAFAQWGPVPLRLPYLFILALAVTLLAAIALRVPETVTAATGPHRGVLSVRRPRFGETPGLRSAFVVGCLSVTAAWSVAGLYLALGGSMAKELLHANNHLLAGLVILCVQGVGGVSTMVLTSASNRTNAVTGCLSLILGMGLVALALHTSNTPLFFLGDAATGIGFGLAFLSGTRRVTQAAPVDRRGETLAAYFVVAYLAISVPVIAVGLVATHLGLVHTFYLFALIASAVAAAALVGTVAARFQPPAAAAASAAPGRGQVA